MVALEALSALAVKNQNRALYEMSFEFKSDQDEVWKETFTLDTPTWFNQRVVEVSVLQPRDRYLYLSMLTDHQSQSDLERNYELMAIIMVHLNYLYCTYLFFLHRTYLLSLYRTYFFYRISIP